MGHYSNVDSNFLLNFRAKHCYNFTLTPASKPNLPACRGFWATEEVYNVFVGRQEPGFELLSRSVLMPDIVWASRPLPNDGASQKQRSIPMPLGSVGDESKNRQSVGSALQSLSHRFSQCPGVCHHEAIEMHHTFFERSDGCEDP